MREYRPRCFGWWDDRPGVCGGPRGVPERLPAIFTVTPTQSALVFVKVPKRARAAQGHTAAPGI